MPPVTPTSAPVAPSAEDQAAALAEPFEGFSADPYWDPNGKVWSQGFGSTHDAQARPITQNSPPITREIAIEWLEEDMNFAFQDIAEVVKEPLTDGQKAALASFIYNVGSGNFNGSTLLRLLNQGQFSAAAAQFDLWDHSGGVELAGLLRRRQAETALFLGKEA